MTIENRPFSTDSASLQNGAVEFLKISFFIPFTTQLDSVDKEKPRTESFRSIGSSLRHSGRAKKQSLINQTTKRSQSRPFITKESLKMINKKMQRI